MYAYITLTFFTLVFTENNHKTTTEMWQLTYGFSTRYTPNCVQFGQHIQGQVYIDFQYSCISIYRILDVSICLWIDYQWPKTQSLKFKCNHKRKQLPIVV